MKNICIVGYGAIGPIHAQGISTNTMRTLFSIYDSARNGGAEINVE